MRLCGSRMRRISHRILPATVKRTAAKRSGGTKSTTYLTATKLVPKKKTVISSETSTQIEARLRSSFDRHYLPALADEVGALVEVSYVGGDEAGTVFEVF